MEVPEPRGPIAHAQLSLGPGVIYHSASGLNGERPATIWRTYLHNFTRELPMLGPTLHPSRKILRIISMATAKIAPVSEA